jgi:hypothetical protein
VRRPITQLRWSGEALDGLEEVCYASFATFVVSFKAVPGFATKLLPRCGFLHF